MLTTAIFFEHAIFNLERLALRAHTETNQLTYGSHSGDPRTADDYDEGECGRHAMALVNTKAAGAVAYPRLFSPPLAHLNSTVLAPSSRFTRPPCLGSIVFPIINQPSACGPQKNN